MSVKIIYTGAQSFEAVQPDPVLSLGDFPSSSEAGNDALSNVFPEITPSSIAKNEKLYSALAVKNLLTGGLSNFDFTVASFRNAQGNYKGALVAQTLDECQNAGFPNIPNVNSKPIGVTFANCQSFYGQTELVFNRTIQEGEIVDVYVSAVQVGSLVYEPNFERMDVDDESAYALVKDFDYTNKVFKVYLLQKDLDNFDTAVTLQVGAEDVTGTIVNTAPTINRLTLTSVDGSGFVGVYLERTIARELRLLSESDACERLFAENEAGVSLTGEEVVDLKINYDTP